MTSKTSSFPASSKRAVKTFRTGVSGSSPGGAVKKGAEVVAAGESVGALLHGLAGKAVADWPGVAAPQG